MKLTTEEALNLLEQEGKLNKRIFIWGIGQQTPELLDWFKQHGGLERIAVIIDNFKYTFWSTYRGIPVIPAESLCEMGEEPTAVILAINYAGAVRKQLSAVGFSEIYNLRNLEEQTPQSTLQIPYYFSNRSKNYKYMCYVLAGYDPELWDCTLARVNAFQKKVLTIV